MTSRPVHEARLDSSDTWWLLALGVMATAYVWRLGNLAALPAEDAAILMRYAHHLAEGHGIVWNIGERPVDGATDFLFMVAVAGLMKFGLRAELAVRVLTLGAWFGMLGLVYVGNRVLQGAPRWVAGLSCGFLITGPALSYVEAMFGTPVFGFCAALTWLLAIVASRRGGWVTAFAFAVSGLTMGLVRPDGVFLAAFMLLSIAILSPHGVRRPLIAFACVFGLIGGAYFAWHWWYFGHALPNPFYRKAHHSLELDALRMPVRNVVILLNVLLLAFAAGLIRRSSRRETVALAVPVLGFTILWILLSNEMNYRMRFQFALVPVTLISWPALVPGLWRPARGAASSGRRVVRAAWVTILAGLLVGQALVYRRLRPVTADGRYDVAIRLEALADRGYVLATSEAGLLPLYSRWTSVDAWGLNDVTIAHEGVVTAEYLDRFRPHLVVFHADFGPGDRPERPASDPWKETCLVLRDYAVGRGYRLAALWGTSSTDFHYYYVRPDFPDAARVAEIVSAGPYPWWLGGDPASNQVGR